MIAATRSPGMRGVISASDDIGFRQTTRSSSRSFIRSRFDAEQTPPSM
jgi:hypothetical protein